MFSNRKEINNCIYEAFKPVYSEWKIGRKTLKNCSPKYKSENVNKVKNEFKLNVDEQQYAKNHLK